jgi:hypothetical protein
MAEATVPQIATITGHSLKDVEAILDAHDLGREMELAEIVIAKLTAKSRRTRCKMCGVFPHLRRDADGRRDDMSAEGKWWAM